MIPVTIHFWVAYFQKNLHLGEKDTLQEMDQSFRRTVSYWWEGEAKEEDKRQSKDVRDFTMVDRALSSAAFQTARPVKEGDNRRTISMSDACRFKNLAKVA